MRSWHVVVQCLVKHCAQPDAAHALTWSADRSPGGRVAGDRGRVAPRPCFVHMPV